MLGSRSLVLAIVAIFLSLIVPACPQQPGHEDEGAAASSPDDSLSCAEDGSATAPSGQPQRLDLLKQYRKISPCQVAGVSYAVGYGGTTLRDPVNCDCLPAGTTVDSIHNFIRVTNAPNVTLSDFDFSLHGGYLVYCDGSPNLTIENSNFAIGTSGQLGVAAYVGCTNIKIAKSVFDGAGSLAPCDSWSVVTTRASGISLRYNWFKNFSQHVLEANGGGAVDYRYNLVEDGGTCPTAHLNYSQLQGDYLNPRIAFNTFIQHVRPAGGEGVQIEATGTITNARVEYNTIISVQEGPRKALSAMIACHQDRGAANIGFVARSNFLDVRGAYHAFYPGACPGARYSDNWNMVTGAALPERP